MTGSSDFEDRIRRVLDDAARHVPVRRVDWQGPSRPAGRGRPRVSLAGIGAVVAVVVAVGIVVLALAVLRHAPASNSGSPAAAPPPHSPLVPGHLSASQREAFQRVRKEITTMMARNPGCRPRRSKRTGPQALAPNGVLLSQLGVLRRPTQPSDRIPERDLSGIGGITSRYARFARRVGSTSYYVVPVNGIQQLPGPIPPRCLAPIRAAVDRAVEGAPAAIRAPILSMYGARLNRLARSGGPQEGICVLAIDSRGPVAGNCSGPAAYGAEFDGFYAGNGGGYGYGVVPDGVAKIGIHYAGRTITGGVVNNVYVVRVPARDAALPHDITLLAANGNVVPQAKPSAGVGEASFGFSSGPGPPGAAPQGHGNAPKNSAFCRQNPQAC